MSGQRRLRVRGSMDAHPLHAVDGFTMVEVLVVTVVIGTLVAIALPSFMGQRDRAKDADAQSAAVAAQKALAAYSVDHDGYAGATAADLADVDPSLTPVVNAGRLLIRGTTTTAPTRTSYVVGVRAGSTGTWFAFYRDAQGVRQLCTPSGHGGCGDAVSGLSLPGYGPAGAW